MLAVRGGLSSSRASVARETRGEGAASLRSSSDWTRRQVANLLRRPTPAGDEAPEIAPRAGLEEPGDSDDALMQLIAAAKEDLNRVDNLVHNAGYAVVVCDGKGTLIYYHDPRRPASGEAAPAGDDCRHLLAANGAALAATAIFEEDDRPVAFLGVAPSDITVSEASSPIVGAVLRASARAIEERQFRARHRARWIVAGVQHGDGRSDMLLAFGRNGNIVGADRAARQLLLHEGHGSASALSLWSVFERNESLRSLPQADEVACVLVGRRTGERWWVLVTPPAPLGRRDGLDSGSAHARPRLDGVGPWDEQAMMPRSRGGLAPYMLRRVREHIDAHISGHIDVEALAATAGLSTFHFSRAFKQSVGMAPHAYVISRRLQKARDLLAEAALGLAEVALACGFADQSHFTRVFSRELGITPGAWRRAQMSHA